jgi:D-hydroxyproline dehydrogenase subunit gamma
MFKRQREAGAADVSITIDGRPSSARGGDSVAAALLAAGVLACRTTAVSGAPRGPFCLMGACFDCLVTIDGHPNRQACLVAVRAGMRIERQAGAAALVRARAAVVDGGAPIADASGPSS